MLSIKAIIFDLSGVLINGLVGTEQYLNKCSGKIKAADFFMSELDDLFLGKISEVEYWQIVLKKNGWKFSIDDLKKAVRKNFKEIAGTREIIKKLKKKYKLGLLSVHAKEWIEYCEKQLKYTSLFDMVSYSFECTVCKPDKEAFKIILDKLQVKPAEALFIDDFPENTQSAKEIGLATILFQSPIQLKNDLAKLGVI